MEQPPRQLRRLPSWLLSQAALQGHRIVSETLAAEGMRKHHFTVLLTLDEYGASSQAELGRRLSIDRSDMAAVMADLERDGLVSRARDERDRRRNVVRLTAAGSATLERLGARIARAQEQLLEPLSAGERRQLEALLTQVLDHHVSRAGPRSPSA